MTYDDLLEKLNIRLGDSDNFAFTIEEKQEALDEAFNDEHVVDDDWDSSLTFSHNTSEYPLPSGVGTVMDIYIKVDNNLDEPEKIASNLWEVINGNIQFKPGAKTIPEGWTLYIKGRVKFTTDDSVTAARLQEFILNSAQLHCLNMYGTKKALKFIKNDTSMSEIITFKRELERKVAGYKARIPRSFENS